MTFCVVWRPDRDQLLHSCLAASASGAGRTFGPLCSTYAALGTYVQSNQLRGGGWKDWKRLFIVPYRQGCVGPGMEVHCVVSPCLRHE